MTESFLSQLTQVITFPAISTQVFGASFPISAAASSGLPITYSTTGPVTVVDNTILVTGLGRISIRAYQGGNSTYLAAPSVLQSFTAVQAPQSISLPTVPAQVPYSPASIALPAFASSGLPIIYSVVSGPVTIANDVLTLTGVGAAVITANQAGNADYAAAPEVTVSTTIEPSPQTITFPAIANQTVGATITLAATSSSGLPISYTRSGPVKFSGGKAIVTGPGSVVIGAMQSGNGDYAPAAEVRDVFTVSAAP